jgi:DNA-binding response OmpR family regulator
MTQPTERHLALLVEDDPFYIDQQTQILNAIGCDVIACDNKEDALRLFHEKRFCLVFLDMSIRGTSDGIKDRPAFGFTVLDELRQLSPHHNGVCWWLPIVATSAVVSTADDVVRVMRLGAATFIAKTVSELELSEILNEEFRRSGRDTHQGCFARPVPPGLPAGVFSVRITGEPVDQRTVVLLGDCRLTLTENELHTLLKLGVHDGKGFGIHKSKLADTQKSVSQQIDRLRRALEPAAGDRQIVDNDGKGYYRLSPQARIVACDAAAIAALYRSEVADLAGIIAARIDVKRRPSKKK